jgi:hypothetical protein
LDQLLAQGGRDPLIKAVHDCQICAARLIRVYQVNPDTPADGERAEFKRKLGYVDQLMLGNPIRQGVKIQSLLRNVYR